MHTGRSAIIATNPSNLNVLSSRTATQQLTQKCVSYHLQHRLNFGLPHSKPSAHSKLVTNATLVRRLVTTF